jgi:hypothetical protein
MGEASVRGSARLRSRRALPRTASASVAAAEETSLLVVEREAFLAALNASTHVHEAAGRLARRLLAHVPADDVGVQTPASTI